MISLMGENGWTSILSVDISRVVNFNEWLTSICGFRRLDIITESWILFVGSIDYFRMDDVGETWRYTL